MAVLANLTIATAIGQVSKRPRFKSTDGASLEPGFHRQHLGATTVFKRGFSTRHGVDLNMPSHRTYIHAHASLWPKSKAYHVARGSSARVPMCHSHARASHTSRTLNTPSSMYSILRTQTPWEPFGPYGSTACRPGMEHVPPPWRKNKRQPTNLTPHVQCCMPLGGRDTRLSDSVLQKGQKQKTTGILLGLQPGRPETTPSPPIPRPSSTNSTRLVSPE